MCLPTLCCQTSGENLGGIRQDSLCPNRADAVTRGVRRAVAWGGWRREVLRKAPSRAARFLQPSEKTQCLPPARKPSDGGGSLAGCSSPRGGEGFLRARGSGLVCGSLGTSCEVRRDTSLCSRALPIAEVLGASAPAAHRGAVLGACVPARPRRGELASHGPLLSGIRPLGSGAGRGSAGGSQRPAGKTHVPALLRGLCRWPRCSPQQSPCLKVHPAGRKHAFGKYRFQMAGLLG